MICLKNHRAEIFNVIRTRAQNLNIYMCVSVKTNLPQSVAGWLGFGI